jgi:hypothetical protein
MTPATIVEEIYMMPAHSDKIKVKGHKNVKKIIACKIPIAWSSKFSAARI